MEAHLHGPSTGLMITGPKVSVVITAYNSAKTIGPCLQSLKAQQGISPDDIEVILIDDRSSDNIIRTAMGSGIANLRVYRLGDYELFSITARQRALDAGIRHARGEFIFLIDADGLAPGRWIHQVLHHFAQTGAHAICGPVEFDPPPSHIAGLQSMDAYFYLGFCRLLNALGHASGAYFGNFAFRRSIYFRVGGFETIGFSLTEDLSFVRALHKKGFLISFQSDAIIRVRAAETWKEVMHRSKRVSAGGLSWLAFAMAWWVVLLPFLATAGLFWSPLLLLFFCRYVAGVAFNIWSVPRGRRAKLLPYAMIYEPVAILTGLLLALELLRDPHIQWGGVVYKR